MRGAYIAVAVVVIAVASFLGYGFYDLNTARESLKNIQVSIGSALPTGITQDSLILRVGLSLYNNGSTSSSIDRVAYELYIGDVRVGSGSYAGRVEIPPKGSVTLNTEFTVQRSSLGEAFTKIIAGGGLSIKLRIYMYRNTLLGSVEEAREISFRV